MKYPITGNNQKSILLISHSYTPILNPRAFRWTSLAEDFVRQGFNVDVVTSWQPELAREEIRNGVNIFRVGGSVIEKIRTRIAPADKKIKVSNDSNHEISNLRNILSWMHDHSWKKLYWPDYACLWKKPAARAALNLMQIEKHSTLITVSDPFTSHLVGQIIKKRNKDLNWMVDIGDPFCFRHDTPTNNHSLYYRLNYSTEEQIFEQADSISVTTESTKQKYAELFSDTKNKIYVIPPLMADTNTTGPESEPAENNKIKMVFVGTLYKAIRNPSYLLSMFDTLMQTSLADNLELHFYGGVNDCKEEFTAYQKYKNNSLFIHGLVSREKVLQAMNNASVLINIGNDNIYQLPSKVVEYMVTGKPVINIARFENDSSLICMESYPSSLTLFDNKEYDFKIEAKKCRLFINNLPNRLSEDQRRYWKEKFSVTSISSQYQSVLSNKLKSMEVIS